MKIGMCYLNISLYRMRYKEASPRKKNGWKCLLMINFKFNLKQKRLFSNCFEGKKMKMKK